MQQSLFAVEGCNIFKIFLIIEKTLAIYGHKLYNINIYTFTLIKRKRIMMKKRYAIITVVAILIIMVIAIYRTSSNVVTVPAEITTIENKVNTKGFIVRDEVMYYATASGTAYFGAVEGERVSKDSQIATIFEGKVSDSAIKELSVIDTKLRRAREDEGRSILHRSDTGSIENDILSHVNELYDYAEKDDIEKIAEVHNAVDSLRTTGEYNVDTGVGQLEDEKWEALEKIDKGRKEIYTEISGVFSTYLDGLESVLAPQRIEQYNPDYIKGLSVGENRETDSTKVETGDPICKIMNNHVWYTLVVLTGDSAAECEMGKSVRLRFRNMADAEVDGVIDYVSDLDESGDRLVRIRCSTYVESVFSYREADVDIIFKSYTGCKVPVNAIRAGEDKKFVIGQAGTSNFNCDINILYTDRDGEYSIVESTDNAVNKLSKAERIVVSDIK